MKKNWKEHSLHNYEVLDSTFNSEIKQNKQKTPQQQNTNKKKGKCKWIVRILSKFSCTFSTSVYS